MSHNAPPKETAAHNRTTFLSIVFVVSLRSVEQTSYITARCKWRKLSCEKSCGVNNEGFLTFVSRCTHARHQKWAVFAGYYHDKGKKNVNESLKYKCFMCSSLCSANERIYIFWKCLIEGFGGKVNFVKNAPNFACSFVSVCQTMFCMFFPWSLLPF